MASNASRIFPDYELRGNAPLIFADPRCARHVGAGIRILLPRRRAQVPRTFRGAGLSRRSAADRARRHRSELGRKPQFPTAFARHAASLRTVAASAHLASGAGLQQTLLLR